MTVTMVHTELQVIEIDMSNIDGNASRLNPSADCTAALEGFSFQPQCMQQFNSISCGAVDREKNEAPPGWSKLFSGSL